MKKNNVRYLTSTLVAASLLGSAPSYALGIGEMKLKSALNQNLQAEISLLLSNGENANDIKVNLAPNAKFDEAGIPWTIFLSKIKFQVVNQNGKTFIKLSSKEALKEPFLDFLIEVKNAKGSLYREFTVLVDPPAAYEKPIDASVSKPTVDTSLPLHFIDAPAIPVNFESSTYTIQENDTLWKIASQFNQQNNVSVHRMIAAILIANPEAFQKDKTHTMIVGKMLKIPSFVESPHLFKPTQTTKVPVKKVAPVKKIARVEKEKAVANPLAKTKSPEPAVETVKEDKTKESKPATVSDETQKRITEMEQQLAQMKKMMAEKDAEMEKLKTIEKAPVVEKTPVIEKASVVEKAPDKPLGQTPASAASESLAISQTPPIVSPITTKLDSPVVVLPPALPQQPVQSEAVTADKPAAVQSVAVPAIIPPAPVAENVLGITGDLYYYVVGGVGSLLLGVLGWLRLREKKKVQPIELEQTTTQENIEPKTEPVFAEVNEAENTIIDESALDNSLFEEASHEFAEMISHDIDRHSVDDVLYKVDVYCSYGNFEHAETLLREEFTKNPNAHDYALRLLKLYQDGENTEGFKEFVFELAELGKRDEPDFWAKVVEKCQAFYPEALFFMPPESKTNALNLEKNEPNITPNFDALFASDSDEQEIMFGELSEQETLSASSVDDMFAQPFDVSAFETQTDKKEPDMTIGGFTLDDMFKTEPETLETPQIEAAQMLDFGDFETLETQEFKTTVTKNVTVPDIELEFNFGDFVMPEKEIVQPETVELPAIEEPKFELDFGEFKFEKTPAEKTEIAFEAPVAEMNFADFSAPETVELPAIEEAKFELDFGEFKFAETPAEKTEISFEAPVAEMNFADFSAPETVELPTIEEPKFELDFGEFKFEETPAEKTEIAFEAPIAEMNFADFSAPETVELPAIEEPKFELDFGEFKFEETPAEKTEIAFEAPVAEMNFADFSAPETVELPVIEEAKFELDFGEFKFAETLTEKTEIAFEAPVAEMNFADFTLPEITAPEMVQPAPLEKTTPKVEFSEFVATEKPFAEPEKMTFKPQIDFESVSEIVEKRIQQAYLELEKVKSKDELDLSYLEMSDEEFAQALADEVLKKCQIKEQLCRQKITLEVLTKLS